MKLFGRNGAIVALSVLILVACGGDGGGGPTEPAIIVTQQKLSTPVNGASRYLLYLPKDYGLEPAKKWPLVVFMHGSQDFSNLGLESLSKQGVMGYMKTQNTHLPAIVVQPQQDVDLYDYPIAWHDPVFMDAVIQDVEARYSVDKARVSITGGSMGGFASWAMALSFPNRFSAVMPVAGGLVNDDMLWFASRPLTTTADWGRAFDAVASNTVRVYSSKPDGNVPIAVARNAVTLLRSSGGNPDSREDSSDHGGIQLLAFQQEPIEWLIAQTRVDADSRATPIPRPDEFAGDYHFETGGKVRITSSESQITLAFGGDRRPVPFIHIRDDRFIAGWMMRALRDSAGNVKCFVTPIPGVVVPYAYYPDLIRDDATEPCRE